MRIDGRDMAKKYGETLAEKVSALSHAPILRVFVLSKDKATEQFIAIKKRAGESVGAIIEVIDMPETTTTDELIDMIKTAVEQADGIIVQLPLPSSIDTERVLAALPASHDVDGIGGASGELLPPVVAAFEHILKENNVGILGKKIVVLGHGRLVGKPAAQWFEREGGEVIVCDKSTPDMCAAMSDADIIVLGAGAPHLVKPDMIKEGAIILDAGTSEAGGKVVGDADPACEMKASLFTPVPGGIGPLAVMMIFKNLHTLARSKEAISN
jgi:methylenetetrahydrofolate dehydrogenase (NADP+)/methenyltetrahydrofolate cyclohydrolase